MIYILGEKREAHQEKITWSKLNNYLMPESGFAYKC